MSWNRLLICITLVLVLWLTLVLSTNGHRKVSTTQDIAIADTIYNTIIEEVHDTIYNTKPIFVEIKTVDTVFITDTTYLYVVQKHYQKNGLYDLWISGVEPLNLDSFIIYQKTRYNKNKSLPKNCGYTFLFYSLNVNKCFYFSYFN